MIHPHSPTIDPAKLAKLAHTAVHVGVELKPGQELIIAAPLEAAPLVRLVTAEAYKAGASLVTTFYADEEAALLRFQHGQDASFDAAAGWLYNGMAEAYKAGAARLSIVGDNPFLLNGQDPARVMRAGKARSIAAKPAMEYITSLAIPWSIVAYPTRAWAKTMFPSDEEASAVHKLAEAIFATSRVNGSDPAADWKTHSANLATRRDWLNARNFHALRFMGPDTDLTVGLADGHKWQGGASTTRLGGTCNANIPTEEVFTTPHSHRVDGHVRSTKPLSCNGTLIEDIRVTFQNGKIVHASAAKGEAVFKKLIETDEGAARLGEVALVPHSSPISQSGLVFYETLFDENAACHIALGQCYTECFTEADITEDAATQRGGNQSLIHVDWMIGSGQVNIDGLHADGTTVPVMRNGEWAF
ncbi:MAG: aminopeptidase [Alphaproteobacteria bacterium]|nr:MAG: aminopeptidase [Alphaproteobacteria bacterium]